MRIGNKIYDDVSDVPAEVPVFPLSGALLLPRMHLPLNIFEPRYIALVDHVLSTDRVIGMVQPRFDGAKGEDPNAPRLCEVGALGRIVYFEDMDDGRYVIKLAGVSRFELLEELPLMNGFRRCRISAERFASDLHSRSGETDVDRQALIGALQTYLDANDLEVDWKSVRTASNEALVNTLAMLSPYGPAEKQALLEAPDLKARAATLVAITEIEVARQSGDKPVLN